MEDFSTGATKNKEGNQLFYFSPFAIDMMLSFIDKEKQKDWVISKHYNHTKKFTSLLWVGMGIMFKPTDKKQKFKIF